MTSDVVDKLKDLLITRLKLKVKPDELTDNTMIFGPEGLGLDSIDVLELVVGIKREFGVEITDRETAERVFTSLGAIARYVEEHR